MTATLTQPTVATMQVEDSTIHFVPSGAPVDGFIDWVMDKQMLGFDVETGGSDPLNHHAPDFCVRIISFATRDEAWVLEGTHVDTIRQVLSSDTIFVAHNATFDALSCRRAFGVQITNLIDTMLLALLVYPPDSDDDDDDDIALHDRHALKPLSGLTGSKALINADGALHRWFQDFSLKAGDPKPRGGDRSKAVGAWEGRCYATCAIDDPRYWAYNGLDGVFCVRLLAWLLKRWEGDPTAVRALTRDASKVGQILSGIQWRGLRVDREALGAIFRDAVTAQEEMLTRFKTYTTSEKDPKDDGPHVDSEHTEELNPASHVQMDEWFRYHGVIDPVESEATGLVSTDKNAGMPRLQDPEQPDNVRELAALLVEYRGHQQLRGKVREIAGLALRSADGRVHCRVNALKAKTGRMSINDPALQNLPKNDPRIRAAFLAEEGYLLVGADFSQVEFRVAAALSEDQNMIDAILEGLDLHNVTATRIFGPEFTDQQRGYAKNVGFCVQYGGGPGRVGAMTKLSRQASQNLIDKFFKAYPSLKRYIKKVCSQSTITLPSGRVTSVDPNRTYANLNYYVQGTAADLFMEALLRLATMPAPDGGNWADYLWLVIHDEIILQVPEHLAEQAATALEEAMNTTFLGIPITAEAKILGTRWGKIEEEEPVAA